MVGGVVFARHVCELLWGIAYLATTTALGNSSGV